MEPIRTRGLKTIAPVTAEQLYVNQKVSDLISNAEMEQSDYPRFATQRFRRGKSYFDRWPTSSLWNTLNLLALR
jgi:hypothetical protein